MDTRQRDTHDDIPSELADKRRDDAIRRALATPPISNEDILKRSKESRASKAQSQ